MTPCPAAFLLVCVCDNKDMLYSLPTVQKMSLADSVSVPFITFTLWRAELSEN